MHVKNLGCLTLRTMSAKRKKKAASIKALASTRAAGLTLDTGALIALENNNRRVQTLIDASLAQGLAVRTPAAAVTEFWNGSHSKELREIIEATFVTTTLDVAKRAGDALTVLNPHRAPSGPGVADALVAASASVHGDIILSSDAPDMLRLAMHFGRLRVLKA